MAKIKTAAEFENALSGRVPYELYPEIVHMLEVIKWREVEAAALTQEMGVLIDLSCHVYEFVEKLSRIESGTCGLESMGKMST